MLAAVAGFAVCVIGVGAWWWNRQPRPATAPASTSSTETPSSMPAIAVSEYNERARQIAEHLRDQLLLVKPNTFAPIAAGAKRDLMQLVVPKEKQNAHLALVLALSRLEGEVSDSDRAAALAAIERAVETILSSL